MLYFYNTLCNRNKLPQLLMGCLSWCQGSIPPNVSEMQVEQGHLVVLFCCFFPLKDGHTSGKSKTLLQLRSELFTYAGNSGRDAAVLGQPWLSESSHEDVIEGVLWFFMDFPPAQLHQLLQTCS